MKRTITRILALALSLVCLFTFAPMRPAHADGAFPENVTIQSERNNAFDYLEYYSGGRWKDLNTPRHWIESTGQVCYCIEHIASLDRHGKQPMILCCTSAEEEYINDIESCEKAALFSRLQEEIQCLCSEDQSILTTYMTGSKGVSQVAQSLGISERTIYNRRQRIAKQIRKKVLKGCRK